MILDWFAQAPMFGLAVAVLFLPGLLVGVGLRLRGLTLWAAAPGISAVVLATLAILYPFLAVRWSGLSAGIGMAVVALLVALFSFVISGNRNVAEDVKQCTRARRNTLLLIAGLFVGGGLNAARLLTYVGVPTAISQTNDAVFHLNALRWISEVGSASSLDLTGMIGAASFYPGAWHAITSLVAFDNTLIPLAANMVALVIVALVWPLGIALLARVLSRGDALIAAFAAALSAGLLVFPQLMIEWGVLYPYALSLALVPTAVALAIVAMRHGILPLLTARPMVLGSVQERVRGGVWPAAIASVLIAGGILLAQPSSALVWGLLVLLWISAEGVRLWHSAQPLRCALAVVVIVAWVLFGAVWAVLAYLAGPVLWTPYRSVPGAAVDVMINSHSQVPPAIAISALMVVGLVAAVRQSRWRWIAVAWAFFSLLYVVSVATDIRVIKRALTGPWYGDSFRLAAIIPIVVIPLAALGLAVLVRALARRVPLGWRNDDTLAVGALVVFAILGSVSIAIAPVHLLRVAEDTDRYSRYAMTEDSYLSSDEFDLLTDLRTLLPEDAVIIGNPSTGISFAYVLGQRDVIPRTWSPPSSQAWDELAAHLRDVGEREAGCEALDAYGSPTYVLDFGPGSTGPGLFVMPGMTDFEGQPGFELVERRGEASLWEITACS